MLRRLQLEGGIEVLTPDPVLSGASTEEPAPPLIRTMVQPDADIITYVGPSALHRPEICDQHLRALQGRLETLRRFRRDVRYAVIGARVAGGGLLAASGWESWAGYWRDNLFWTASGFVFGAALVFGKTIARRVFRIYFRKMVNENPKRQAG